jgi:hypothetical protein
MRRFFTLVCLLCLAIPAGISISGCTRNPAANYCNGAGYGLKITDVASIDLEPRTTGVSMAFGQTRQAQQPTAKTCKGTTATASSYTYGTTNNQLVDISPSGNMCAGQWNRNSGGGIADYTICNFPKPLPKTNGQPYGVAYITASASAVTSNPVPVYVHAAVTSVSLAGAQAQCFSQGEIETLDAQACYSTTVNGKPANALLCAPSTVTDPTQFACPLPPGLTRASIPTCTASIGTLTYTVSTSSVANLNSETNQITANLPGTTAITASVAGSGSSAGYFSTCPPASISVKLANGNTSGTITQGVTQNLVTTVTDTKGQVITGLTLDYQSTDPIDITAAAGSVLTSFPGVASIYAVCQPGSCNPSPINQVGLYGTGLSVTSNPVTITTPGTASDYVWFAAPGQSQYVVPVELLLGTVGSTVRLPYVPNSMVMDRLGSNLYFGSVHGIMIYNTTSNTVTKQDPSAPGVVLAVSPNGQNVLVNDQQRKVFYLYVVGASTGNATTTFGGLGSAAAWTPDSKTLYVTDSAELNNSAANIAAGITGHTDTLYVNNLNTGWTSYPLAASSSANPGAQNLAITIPGVGAFLSGNPTVAHTWCPSGNISNYASMLFYPQPAVDSINAITDVLAATTDGKHILGAAFQNSSITLTDIGVTIPTGDCPAGDSNGNLFPLPIPVAAPVTQTLTVNATGVNQVIPSPASNLAFVTYTGTTSGATLPFYVPGGSVPVGYLPLTGTTVTAPVAGAFSPDDQLFFVSTAGDNMIHYISVPKVLTDPTHADTEQIAPNLPVCTPSTSDTDCIAAPNAPAIVPATAVAVKPRSTT